MRRSTSLKRGRVVTILLAGGVGYLLGGWHAATLRSTEPSPAQAVALRFPVEPVNLTAAEQAADVPDTAGANVLGNPKLALLSPDPLVAARRSDAPVITAPAAPERAAATAAPTPPLPRPRAAAPRVASVDSRPAQAPVYRHPDRSGFMLDDTQIASIKQRLHLTADQERMWPAVEAALRNIAYEKARDARRGGAGYAANVASLDPNGAAVQDLKSAAIPLIMSFNDDQRNEVRSLAHVMGLDRLASEF